jgi:hypothetical protein
MEVNFVVALKFHLAELEITSDIGNILDTTNLCNTTRQSENVKNHVPTKVNVLHIDSIALTIFDAMVNVDNKVFVVGTSMDTKDATLVQLETIANLATTLPNTSMTLENV